MQHYGYGARINDHRRLRLDERNEAVVRLKDGVNVGGVPCLIGTEVTPVDRPAYRPILYEYLNDPMRSKEAVAMNLKYGDGAVDGVPRLVSKTVNSKPSFREHALWSSL